MFKLASLFVDIAANDQEFQGKLGGIQAQLGGMGTAAAVAVGNLSSAAILGATRAVAGFFSEGVRGAVDLAETTSKVRAIFGDASGTIQGEADAMAARFGVVKAEFLNAASGFGAAFKAAGASQADAAKVGNQLAKLGMDMASFGNASNAEVFTALQAALRGEFDPLERFNVMMSAAKVEAEALSLGLAKNARDLDESAKKQATLSLIMKGTVDQQGELERTADGSANSWRKLTGTLTNLATAVGATLEPALNAVIGLGNEMAAGLVDAAGRADGAFAAFADGVKSAADFVGLVWRNFGDVWDLTTVRIGGALANGRAVVEAFAANVVQYAGWLGRNWHRLLADALNATTSAFQAFAENVAGNMRTFWDRIFDPEAAGEFSWKPLLDGFQATAEKLPDLIKPAFADIQGDVDAIEDRMFARESERIDKLNAKRKDAFVGPPLAGKGSSGDGGKPEKFKPELVASADLTAKIRASIFGGDDTAKKQLAAAERTARASEETAEAVKKPRVAIAG